jgi:hypothetical protein
MSENNKLEEMYDYDAESMYNDDQQFFAKGMANDVAKSYIDLKAFLQQKYPELQIDDPKAINKIALTIAETWVQILVGRVMASEMEKEEQENMWFPSGGKPVGGH